MKVENTNFSLNFIRPSVVSNISRSRNGDLAISYANGSFVITNSRDFSFTNIVTDSNIKPFHCLCWVGEHLFVPAKHGMLNVYDSFGSFFTTYKLKSENRCRAIASSKDNFAVGDDDGFVTYFSFENNSVHEIFHLNFSEKILALDIDPDNSKIALSTENGQISLIKIQDENIKFSHRLSSNGCNSNKAYCVKFSNNHLFSGDRQGNITIWDIEIGGIIKSFPVLDHPIFCLLSVDNIVLASGIDSRIVTMERSVDKYGQTFWENSGFIKGCKHDIKGMCFIPTSENLNDLLCVVGASGRLQLLPFKRNIEARKKFIDNYSSSYKIKYSPSLMDLLSTGNNSVYNFPIVPNVISQKRLSFGFLNMTYTKPILLINMNSHMQLIKITDDKIISDSITQEGCVKSEQNKSFELSSRPWTKLGEVWPKKVPINNRICCATISYDGILIAYSDRNNSRILKVTYESENEDNISIERYSDETDDPTAKRIRLNSLNNNNNNSSQSEASSENEEIDSEKNPCEMYTKKSNWHNKILKISNLPPSELLEFSLESDILFHVSQKEPSRLCAFKIETGHILYTFEIPKGYRIQKIVPCSRTTLDIICLITNDGKVRILDQHDGSLVYKTSSVNSNLPIVSRYKHTSILSIDVISTYEEECLLTILYANGLIRQHNILQDDKKPIDNWLNSFMTKNFDHWTEEFSKFKQIHCIDKHNVIVVLDNSMILLSKDKQISVGLNFMEATNLYTSKCPIIKPRYVSKNHSIIQTELMPDSRFFTVIVDEKSLENQLPLPVYKKKFGV